MSRLANAPLFLSLDDLTILPASNQGQPEDITLATRVSKHYDLPFPVLSAAMPTITTSDMAIAMGTFGGLGVIHKFCSIDHQCAQVEAVTNSIPNPDAYPTAAFVGRSLLTAASCDPVDLERAECLAEAGAHLIFLDTPNPSNQLAIDGVRAMRSALEVDLVIGSIVETETAKRYLDLGIDAMKVGLGAGALCSIRQAAGVGAPQATALEHVCTVARDYDVPVIADGGMRCSGDIVKSLAIGASSVMLGSMLAGCDETPGSRIEVAGQHMKEVKGLRLGMFEIEAPTGYPEVDAYLRDHEPPRVEGGDTLLPATGPCHIELLRLLRGIRVGVQMSGAKDLQNLPQQAQIVRVSGSGALEAHHTRS